MINAVRSKAGRAGCVMLVMVAIGVMAAAQGTQDAEFKKIADAFSQAWAKGDAKAIAELHTRNAVRLTGTGEPAVIGTAAIEKSLAAALAGPYKGTTLTIKPSSATEVNPNTYIGEGTWELAGGTVPAGVATRGQYLNTMVREAGVWRIASAAVLPAQQSK